MAVKIRLTRMGKKKQPTYRVVVVDSRKPRDGAFIEQIGRYDPRQEPSLVEIDNERALVWLRNGAQPTDRAKKLLEISGAWTRFRVDKGDIHTIDAAPATVEAEVVEQPEAATEDVVAEASDTVTEVATEVADEAATDEAATDEAAAGDAEEASA
ncbi:MAG TPA: 30S ribosomal protein S16 [Acidimicrobiia bacterium]|jgi:small subunit ribosomal protein S16|nr:30S ribosomal protein S16 [Acidimicrobiia bacterium]